MTAPKSEPQQQPEESSQKLYRALVVDSGPIIKFQANDLNNSANAFYTVPGVLQEIKDAKARHQTLPFELKTREPSPESLTKIIEFARKTGDYPSLSSVDLQVLALVYELEMEGCGVMDHVRTTPKRMLGQSIKAMNAKKKKKKKKNQDAANDSNNNNTDKDESVNKNEVALNHFSEISADDIEFGDDDDREDSDDEEETKQEDPPAPKNTTTPSSWAKLVNPGDPTESSPSRIPVQQQWTIPKQNDDDNSAAGQFSDAEEDDEIGDLNMNQISLNTNAAADTVDNVLEEAFPSLQESFQIPYEEEECPALLAKQEAEQQRLEALQVKSKSGKQYNSFRKYGELVKPKQISSSTEETAEEEEAVVKEDEKQQQEGTDTVSNTQSRINMGQTTGQNAMHAFEDDGEGWVTSTKDIRNMKSAGRLNPTTDPSKVLPQEGKKTNSGPPMHQRTACATTDFAMQNVLLQMKLELVSVDGMKIRRLKSWVQRCGACFKVYYSTENRMLFCAHCGSDMMQRVAASVTGNGRVRLHLKKDYQHNIRGTKYSLPKAGRNDRFQGDLLLREDQLFMRGAWNTKVKKSSAKSNKAVASLFGSDLAEHVGCNSFASDGDIKVGFGRRNPNAAKGGRERRGKKKKSGHKACGLRRY